LINQWNPPPLFAKTSSGLGDGSPRRAIAPDAQTECHCVVLALSRLNTSNGKTPLRHKIAPSVRGFGATTESCTRHV